jgi:O-antigen biosynthesis protein WbqP
VKRLLDLLAASFGILITSPLGIAISLAILLDDGRPVIFTQERVGIDGRMFRIRKFRTMPHGAKNVPSADAEELPITRVGRLLRRSNLDEIPQLFNVLAGTMSLVGPRPALDSQAALLELRRMNNAFSAVPGLTGLAQVNGYDGMTDEVKANFDGQYVDNITLRADVAILFRTVRYLMSPPPRY